MWQIALKTLLADRGKLFTALVGVVFSVVLVNIQGGLFLGLIEKAQLLVANGNADIWVGHRSMHNVDLPRDIPRRWTNRIRPISGVQRAEPYLLGFSQMTLPSGGFESVAVVGVDPATLVGNAWNYTQGSANAIFQTDGIIVDECENEKLEKPRIGEVREIAGKRARITGKTHGIMGFSVFPYVFTSYERAAAYLDTSSDACSYILVQLEPGANPKEVCAHIKRRIPEVDAFTKDEYGRIAVNFWMTRTGLGISFGAATLIGLMVGLVMVGQTLYAMVLDRLSEFGALKAIGASERQIHALLLAQAISMALAGTVIGLMLVSGIQRGYSTPMAPIVVPWWLALGSGVLVLIICLVCSFLPYLRVRKVDPLMVLQS